VELQQGWQRWLLRSCFTRYLWQSEYSEYVIRWTFVVIVAGLLTCDLRLGFKSQFVTFFWLGESTLWTRDLALWIVWVMVKSLLSPPIPKTGSQPLFKLSIENVCFGIIIKNCNLNMYCYLLGRFLVDRYLDSLVFLECNWMYFVTLARLFRLLVVC